MSKCPVCKGSNSQTVKVTESSKSGILNSQATLTCTTCHGSGEITPRELKRWKAEQNLWCNCETPGDPKYWNDRTHPKCSRHCWTCSKCGKILQIG